MATWYSSSPSRRSRSAGGSSSRARLFPATAGRRRQGRPDRQRAAVGQRIARATRSNRGGASRRTRRSRGTAVGSSASTSTRPPTRRGCQAASSAATSAPKPTPSSDRLLDAELFEQRDAVGHVDLVAHGAAGGGRTASAAQVERQHAPGGRDPLGQRVEVAVRRRPSTAGQTSGPARPGQSATCTLSRGQLEAAVEPYG